MISINLIQTKLYYTLVVIFGLLLLNSCTSVTKPKRITLTGTFSLEGQTQHDGIAVAIYATGTHISDFNTLSAIAPQLGINTGQDRVFNFHAQVPMANAMTNSTGGFSLKIDAGSYNIMVYKAGFGYKYFYDLQITSNLSLNSILMPHETELLSDVQFSGVYFSGTHVFPANRNSILTDNVSFVGDAVLIVEPGAIVRIKENSTLIINCNFSIHGQSDSLVYFTGDPGYEDPSTTNHNKCFDSVVIQQEAINDNGAIEYVVFLNTLNGLSVNQNSHVRHNSFHSKYDHLRISLSSGIEVKNNLFVASDISDSYALTLSNTNEVLVNQNLFWKMRYGTRVMVSSQVDYFRNYMQNVHTCVYVHDDCSILFRNNTLKSDYVGVSTDRLVDCEWYYNSFTAVKGLFLRSTYSTDIANNNNFDCQTYAIEYTNYRSGDMNAENNYFYTTDQSALEQLIQDKSDYSPNFEYYDLLGYVDYMPYRVTPVSNAGI